MSHRRFAVVSTELLEIRRLLAAGDVDRSFGDSGLAVQEFSTGSIEVNEVLTVAGGKIAVLGASTSGAYFIRRYNADGTPDVTFGASGEVAGPFRESSSILHADVTADGKFVAMMSVFSRSASAGAYFVGRFNADGSVDTTYGAGGRAQVSLPVSESPSFAFALAPTGEAFAAIDASVVRFTPDGVVDTAFGANGISTGALDDRFIRALHAMDNGQLLLGGGTANELPAADPQWLIAKLDENGAPAAEFGTGGIVTTNFLPDDAEAPFETVGDFVSLPDGRFIAAGFAFGMSAARYMPDGQLDTSFGELGTRRLAGFRGASKAIVDDSGRIYLVGILASVARLTPDGAEDSAFGRVIGSGQVGDGHLFNSSGTLVGDRLVIGGKVGGTSGGSNLVLVGRLTEDDGQTSPISIAGHVINVAGTSGNDDIAADVLDRNVNVSLNGFGRGFAFDDDTGLRVDAGDGDDRVLLEQLLSIPATVNGGNGRDRIGGGWDRDVLLGEGGRDFIDGNRGADYISGGGGKDQLRGQGGNDRVKGGFGNDYLEGGAGGDRLDGGPGMDFLNGNFGDDLLAADDGEADQIFGGRGEDYADADDQDILDGVESQN